MTSVITTQFVHNWRSQRWLVTVLWLVALVQAVIDAVVLSRAAVGVASNPLWAQGSSWLLLPKLVLVFVLVGRVVPERQLAEASVSLRMLAAKALFIVAAVLLPFMLENALVMSVLGIEWLRILVTMTETALWWGCPILGLMLMAVLTTRFLWYVLACLAGVSMMVLSVPAYATLRALVYHWMSWVRVIRNSYAYSEVMSASLILAVALSLSAALLLVLHHAVGSKRLTYFAMAASWIGCLLLTDWYQWDGLKRLQYREATSGPRWPESSVSLTMDPATAVKRPTNFEGEWGWMALNVSGRVESVDREHVYAPAFIRSRWLVNGRGEMVSASVNGFYGPVLNVETLQTLLPDVKWMGKTPSARMDYSLNCLRVTEEKWAKWQETPGTLEVTVDFAVWRFRKIGELPLRVGAQVRDGSLRMVVTKVQRKDLQNEKRLSVSLATTRPFKWTSLTDRYYAYVNQMVVYLLYNPKRNEVYSGDSIWQGEGMDYPGLRRETMQVAGIKRIYPHRDIERVPGKSYERALPVEPIPAEWLQDAVIVCLRAERVGTTTKVITVPGLVLSQVPVAKRD